MTARDIQRRLMVDLYRRSTVVPNYTPSGWWEYDVAEWTGAGCFREYEIKLSLSDFKADATKQKTERTAEGWRTRQTINKHRQMDAAAPAGPVAFHYVAPVGLIALDLLPAWAGLIECSKVDRRCPYDIDLQVVKRAPRLHNQKAKPEIVAHARGVCYWRFMKLFIHGKDEPEVEQQLLSDGAQGEAPKSPLGLD